MKIESKLYLCVIIMFSMHALAQKSKTQNESLEWCHAEIVTGKDGKLKTVLIIGDSHVERYQPVVKKTIKNDFYCSKITTSRSMGDPQFIKQLSGILGGFTFDAICFNNGLHGVNYTPNEYAKYLPTVLKLLKKNNSNVKIFWVTTTYRRVIDNLDSLDNKYYNNIEERNKSVIDFCSKKNIQVIPFSEMSLQHKEYYENDGIHFNELGVNAEAKLIYDELIKIK